MIDLASLPAPVLVPLDPEGDRRARMARLVELFTAAGIPFEVSTLDANPGAMLQRVDNYRETLAKSAINDVYKQTLLRYAANGALDWFAAQFAGIVRMEGENDERFKLRIVLEMENKSGGRLTGYKAACLDASVAVANVGGWVDRSIPSQPTVRLAIMIATASAWVRDISAPAGVTRYIRSQGGGTGEASADLVADVQHYLDKENVKQATDIVTVQSVRIVATDIRYRIEHQAGPDPSLLRETSAKAVCALVDARYVPGRDLPSSAIVAAGATGGVERLSVTEPLGDIVASAGDLIFVNSVTVTSDITDG